MPRTLGSPGTPGTSPTTATQGPANMFVPPLQQRYFLTRECEVADPCGDMQIDLPVGAT